MATQQILFLTSSSLHLYLYQAQTLEYVASFPASAAGVADFDAYLEQAEPVMTRLLVDLIEEDFRLEIIAHTLGRDRQALLSRHSARLFRGTAYRHARVLNRHSGDRHKDEALFSGLINPDSIELWTAVLERHGIPLCGIYSLPLLTGRVVQRVLGRNEDVLFVSESRDSGLRQTFLRKSELRFSRLTAVPAGLGDNEYADFVQNEIGRTKRYLANLHLVERDTQLRVVLLSGGARYACLDARIRDAGLTHYQLLDVDTAARRLGGKVGLDTHCTEALYAQLIARDRIQDHYSLSAQRRGYRGYLQQLGLQAASLLLGAFGLLATAYNISDARHYQAQAEQLQQILPAMRSRYQQAREQLPATELSADGIRSAVSLSEALRSERLLPGPLLARLGQLLQRHDRLVLDELIWVKSFDPSLSGIEATLAGDDQDDGPGMQPASGQAYAVAADPGLYRAVFLRGHLADFNGNYRRAHERIEAFLAAVRRGGGAITATALELPLNVDSNAPVSGGGQNGEQQTAGFLLRVVIREAGVDGHRL